MTSKATAGFWRCYDQLPPRVRATADKQYRIWKRDPFHPSLQFKEINERLWSVRVTQSYRALARRRGELIVWFWIGTHDDYERLIAGS